MKIRYLFLLFAFCFNTSWADFSNTRMWFHPLYIVNEPFILDFRGEWPTDCHPGEQKPVITEYTGDSVLIEFETIVEHPACNDTPTPYRVLVDMSDVVDDVPGEFPFIDVTMRFDGKEFFEQLDKVCLLRCDPPPPPRDIKPEPGLYYSNGLEKQGLLLARQNQRLAAFPLIYDESGSSEWVLGPGGIVEDVFFAKLYESTGGQCLGCLPPDDPPQMGVVGKISMLMDSQGVIQVKINDGLFTTYKLLDFGYGSRDIGGFPRHSVPDLSGRWALVEDFEKSPFMPPESSGTTIIPTVFDIAVVSVNVSLPPIIGIPPPTPPGYAIFSVRDRSGNETAQMKCDYGSDWANSDAEVVCDIYNTGINDGDNLYRVKMLSPVRLDIDYVGPSIPEIPVPKQIAVRVD